MQIGPVVLILIVVFIWAVFGRSQIRTIGRALSKIRRREYNQEYIEGVMEGLEAEDSDVRQP